MICQSKLSKYSTLYKIYWKIKRKFLKLPFFMYKFKICIYNMWMLFYNKKLKFFTPPLFTQQYYSNLKSTNVQDIISKGEYLFVIINSSTLVRAIPVYVRFSITCGNDIIFLGRDVFILIIDTFGEWF